MSYLEDLTFRLAAGLGRASVEFRSRQAAFFRGLQRPDGGFAGREGESDLYYTGFGLRGLAMLGELEGQIANRAASFLKSRFTGSAPVVDFFSLIYAGSLLEAVAGVDVFGAPSGSWKDSVAAELEAFRRDDGGYTKGPEGAKSSTYHTFLVMLCQELIERPHIEPERTCEFILSQRREDGGFVEIAPMTKSGTNPTAAAIGALKILAAIPDDVRECTLDFLVEMQTDEGGLRANTRIPFADILSTFTGLVTLGDLEARDEIDVAAATKFVHALEGSEGGFHAAFWDDGLDVEYAFYGLGATALVAAGE